MKKNNPLNIKADIIRIISESEDYIIAEQIYEKLVQHNISEGRTQETIRKHKSKLVKDEQNLIGSSNKGYFKITTSEKVQEAINYLLNRVPELEQRAAALETAWKNFNKEV